MADYTDTDVKHVCRDFPFQFIFCLKREGGGVSSISPQKSIRGV
jgi:hypothetical protein